MADIQFFAILFSRMGLQKLSTAMGIVHFFRGVKFHEWSTSVKFTEFTYLEKTNYTVTITSNAQLHCILYGSSGGDRDMYSTTTWMYSVEVEGHSTLTNQVSSSSYPIHNWITSNISCGCSLIILISTHPYILSNAHP